MPYCYSYDSFKSSILKHLSGFNEGNPGRFIYKNKVLSYDHILDIPDGLYKIDVICKLLLDDGVEVDMFEKPQQYAHHLNSSQIVCYEFFRPMLGSDRTANDALKAFLKKNHVERVDGNLIGQFEYLPDPEEYTNFDFFLKGNDIKIYFEVKYTENGFGKCDKNQFHKEKFESIYRPMISDCGCLCKEPSFEEFCKYYQLFRNVLRVTRQHGKSEYSVFLYPHGNTIAEKHFQEFKNRYISGNLASHIIGIHWEDCIQYMSKTFRDKFFFYV